METLQQYAHQSPHVHCTVLENSCYYLCVVCGITELLSCNTITMSSAVIVMRLHDKGIEIPVQVFDLPKIIWF